MRTDKQSDEREDTKSTEKVRTITGVVWLLGLFVGLLVILIGIIGWPTERKIILSAVLIVVWLIVEFLFWKQRRKRSTRKKLPWLLSLFLDVQRELDPDSKRILREEQIFQVFRWTFLSILPIIVIAAGLNYGETRLGKAIHPATPTATFTASPTLPPEADSLYYLFIVDASERMKASFDGSVTKWNSIQSSALNHLIYGLPPGANYGLIELGGNPAAGVSGCNDSDLEALKLGPNNHTPLINTIEKSNPGGMASLSEAIQLSRTIFDQRQGHIQKKLFFFLGGGDECSNDQWVAVKYFLKDYTKSTSIDVSTEIVILADEEMDPTLIDELQADITKLGLGNEVSLKAPENDAELQTVMATIFNQTIVEAHEYEPEAVDLQQLANAASTAALVASPVPLQPTAINTQVQVPVQAPGQQPIITAVNVPEVINTDPPIITLTPEWTPSLTPIPPTNTIEPIHWAFTSSDGQYGVLLTSGWGPHCEVYDAQSAISLFTTSPKYNTSDNDVKNCEFGANNTKFAAAYHYSDNGNYTWIGVWAVPSGTFLYEWEKPDWTLDLSGVFDGPP